MRSKAGRPRQKKGNHLFRLRAKAGLSVKEAAQRIGISASMVYALEDGNKKPGTDTVIKICEVYNCTAEQVLRPEKGRNCRKDSSYNQ